MKVLLVEPLGHTGGHFSAHTKYLTQALADAGADVTLLTFDGLLSEPAEWSAKVEHISFTSKSGAFAPVWRFLSSHLPETLSSTLSTICTFRSAIRQIRREKNAVIHILDAYPREFASLYFTSIVHQRHVIFTLFATSMETELMNWGSRFKETFSKREFRICFRLCLIRLLGTRPATALKQLLYRRAATRNHLAFICYTKSVHDSYSRSLYYDKIVSMFRGVAISDQGVLTPLEARQSLDLPQDEPVFLHFGGNHSEKNFEVIFQAAKDLPQPYKLLFAGKIDSVSQANNPLSLVKKYGLEQNTITVDRYIPEEEMPNYFCAANAIIISHRKSFGRASGVLSTAAQFNLPVIASDVGEVGEAVENHELGLTFEPENPQSLREAILSFLNLKDEEKQKMKANLSRFAQDHSWQEVARRHLELYQNALDKS